MSCRAVGCTNRPSMQRSLHFFRFPSSEQDAGRLMKWLLNMRREDWKPTKSARLCSLHFEDHAFTTDSKGNRRLKNTAVPTVFTFPEHLVKKPTTRSTGRRLVNLSTVEAERQKETEPSSGAEVSKSDSSKQDMEEDELDGLPVFGADEEEGDTASISIQQDKQTGDGGESVQCSQTEEGTSQNEGSASSQEPGEGSQEEIVYSPLKKIKEEPIDEDYDKALISSANSDISRVKEELEHGDHETLVPLDELRISSVFSVRGNSDSISAPAAAPQPSPFAATTQSASAIRPPSIVLQAQMQPHFQAHLQLQPKTLAQLQPHLQTHLQARLQTHLQPQLQLQTQLQAQLQTQLPHQLQPQLPHQLQTQLQHQLQPQLPHQIQPQLSHQLPHQLQPQLPHQLQPQLPHQLQPQLPHQLQPQTPPQLQIQPPPHPQVQPQPPPQQQPPPAPVRICCSGCSKVLQKGQTAFQKKGSNQLFCSTMCLTGFTLPPAPIITPKKTCHLCLKVIGNPKDLITVPVDSASNLKEFCSLSCLSIYKSRVEGLAEEDAVVRCAVCRNPSEIQHEVTHQGVLHRLCSDECFSRFRSSKRLSMSCCESCGNCTVTGNYHLVQIEDTVKKFCSPACISIFKQKSGKRVHCPCCQDFKAMDQMLEGTNAQGVIEFFCSSRCVANSQASCTLSGASFPCTNCQKLAVPQYHLAMSDGAIRNFCSYECVGRFQERLHRSLQMNGGSYHSPNTSLHPPVLHRSSCEGYTLPLNALPALNQNTILPYVPASRVTNPHDTQQQPEAPGPVRLTCKQCPKQFSLKPEVLQFKNHVGLFCSRLCCDMYKRERDVKAVCEYCKEEKVAKDVVFYEKQPRTFCCEGCKLLYKHDYAKQHGGQCRVCAYCCNVTHKTIQNHFGGKLEEFCSKECMSLYTVLFYEMAKCHACKNQGPLKERIRWDETVRHFCNLNCLLHFCSKNIIPDQPNSNGINTAATTAQAPLSLSKDMPVIGGVVSLASALAGNTALTGALPTSNASSKIIGDASTQTDVSVNGDPQQRRMLKNKAVMCKPINDEQSIQCELEPSKLLSETVIDENGEKVRLVPVPVPIPVPTPVYIPVPMHLYTQYTPLPLAFPLPVPVPLVVSVSQGSAQPSPNKGSVPSQSSMEDEDVEKCKSRPLSHGDQGSTYSGDLESEARSTPFSWADPEDSSHNLKPSVPLSELEGPKYPPATSIASDLLDVEKDIPLASNDHEATKEQKSSAKRRKRGKKGRRRLVTDVVSTMVSTPPSSKLHHMYGVKAWASWMQWRTQHTDASPLTVKEDVLDCSSEELSDALSHFISEVRRPNGQSYAPDSVYYLCLGIQQYLLENGRLENIFMDPLYNQFAAGMTKLIKDWECNLSPSGFLQSRIEEGFLWECKQLGALSPFVLLNTLIFFGVKHLRLKTAEQHKNLSFSAITHCYRSSKHSKSSYLRFRFAGKDEGEKEKRVILGKRKKEDAEENVEYGEMPENTEDPLQCPVRLYEFYLSKCPDSVKEHPDVFYLQPESSCHPSSSVWYSTQPLDGTVLDSMLSRILAVRDVHLEPKQQQQQLSSSDEDTS